MQDKIEEIKPEIPMNDGYKCVCSFYPGECLWCHDQLAEDSC
jgi:hypothetical protein